MRPFHPARIVRPEILDDQTPDRAAPSLRDIVRLNRIMGGHEVLRKNLRSCVEPQESFSMLDVGAGSGDAAKVVHNAYPNSRVLSLDYRLHHVAGAPGGRVLADAFSLPFPDRSFDIVYCGLFLHHFENDAAVLLLRSFGRVARGFVIVNDLERHLLAYYFLPATRWIFGWDALTLHDGPVSVQAAFTAAELESLGRAAELKDPLVRTHRPAFRLCLVAKPAPDPDKLTV